MAIYKVDKIDNETLMVHYKRTVKDINGNDVEIPDKKLEVTLADIDKEIVNMTQRRDALNASIARYQQMYQQAENRLNK